MIQTQRQNLCVCPKGGIFVLPNPEQREDKGNNFIVRVGLFLPLLCLIRVFLNVSP